MSSKTQRFILIMWLVIIGLFIPIFAQAQEPTLLYLEPVSAIHDENLLLVEIKLDNVNNLYGIDIELAYDPEKFQVQDTLPSKAGVQISPGDFMESREHLVVKNEVDNTAGKINYTATLLGEESTISGSGVLATIVFEVSGVGPYSVDFTRNELADGNTQAIVVQTKDLRLESGDDLPPPTIWDIPQWVMIGIAVLIGGLGALVMTFWLRVKQISPQDESAPPRRMPIGQLSSRESSILLTKQGNNALKQGNHEASYEFFSQAIEFDPSNAQAWLGKGLVAQQKTERRICFERVLVLDSDNATAKEKLEELKK